MRAVERDAASQGTTRDRLLPSLDAESSLRADEAKSDASLFGFWNLELSRATYFASNVFREQ